MSQFFEVHPDNPQPRLLKQAAQILHEGGIAAIPTDSSYALVCHLDDKAAAENLRRLRGVDDKHMLTLLCRDLSELATYARVDNRCYRLLKLGTPGPFTFILQATKVVPRRVSHPQRRTIGLRVPDHRTTQALLAQLGQPLLATTLIAPGEREPMNDAQSIRERYQKTVQAIVDAGACPMQPTTVIDLSGDEPVVVRQGRGDLQQLGLAAAGGRPATLQCRRHASQVEAHLDLAADQQRGCAASHCGLVQQLALRVALDQAFVEGHAVRLERAARRVAKSADLR
jgi:tRNA threonylcarbamoyl adenosine modification protein (Sua5/YciO/YrdC/YwlC family)